MTNKHDNAFVEQRITIAEDTIGHIIQAMCAKAVHLGKMEEPEKILSALDDLCDDGLKEVNVHLRALIEDVRDGTSF